MVVGEGIDLAMQPNARLDFRGTLAPKGALQVVALKGASDKPVVGPGQVKVSEEVHADPR